jgi:hypothetical protein
MQWTKWCALIKDRSEHLKFVFSSGEKQHVYMVTSFFFLFLSELYMSTSSVLEGRGSPTCTLSTLGTVHLPFPESLAQPIPN